MSHADIHVHSDELDAASAQSDGAYFLDDFSGDYKWHLQKDEYTLVPGVTSINTPGHTAGHMSMLIELPQGSPILLTGDAADLQENIDEEIAPGLCWNDREDLALASIRRLKQIAAETGARLWPNHDISFFKSRKPFPGFYS